jgi:hypothetical protein
MQMCETNLSNDPMNCGACGFSCGSQPCVGGGQFCGMPELEAEELVAPDELLAAPDDDDVDPDELVAPDEEDVVAAVDVVLPPPDDIVPEDDDVLPELVVMPVDVDCVPPPPAPAPPALLPWKRFEPLLPHASGHALAKIKTATDQDSEDRRMGSLRGKRADSVSAQKASVPLQQAFPRAISRPATAAAMRRLRKVCGARITVAMANGGAHPARRQGTRPKYRPEHTPAAPRTSTSRGK